MSDRVLMIGLDAADSRSVDRWVEDGSLPNLKALMAAGCCGRLRSSARYLVGSPWPTFYTGRPPTDHGLYHDFQWNPERMGFAVPTSEWLPNVPFWRRLDPEVRVLCYDVPFVLGVTGARGREVVGVASHDQLVPPVSHPPELARQVQEAFEGVAMRREGYGVRAPEELLALRERLLDLTRRSTDVASRLLEGPWDFALVCFGALHRGGHRLWDRSSADRPLGPREGEAFDGALRDLYVECDRSVGALAEAAGDATVVVFALHGMTVNSSRNDFLDAMLARALGGREAEASRPGLVRRLGEALPLGLRRAVTRRVPARVRDAVMTRWVTGGTAWSETRAFALRADLQGYIRINLEGREPEGVVPPAGYEEICERIAQGVTSFRDAGTGEPVVAEVRRPVEVFGHGAREDLMPDLVVCWTETSAARHRALVSDRLGRIERGTPGRIPNGRSGNHRGEGFFVACGAGIPASVRRGESADILDLAPTAVDLLGLPAQETLTGAPIPLAAAGRPPPT